MITIGTADVERRSVVLIYDSQNGEVVHCHEFITLKGGRHPDQQAMEREAMEEFRHMRPAHKATAGFLHVEAAALKPETAYKVDVVKRTLVAQPRRRVTV